MPRALEGRPGRRVGRLKEKTVRARTKQRIHAIGGRVIDELEQRRAGGKSDYVAKLADEIEAGGLAAWKSLRDLLPRDDPNAPNGAAPSMNFGAIFLTAAIEASKRTNAASPVIDATAEHVTEMASDDVDW
jgi:hypothetical protein